MAVDDLVVLGVLDDLEDLLDGTIDVGADTADKNDVLGRRVSGLGANFDGQRGVLTDDAARRLG